MQSVAVTFDSLLLGANAGTEVYPVGAVRLIPSSCPRVLGGCASTKLAYYNSGIARHSYWISTMSAAPGKTTVPQIDLEIHCVEHCIGEVVYTGSTNSGPPGDSGLLVQVSGLLCDQVEFWARVLSNGGADPPYGPVKITINVIFDRLHGSGPLGSVIDVQVIEGALIK